MPAPQTTLAAIQLVTPVLPTGTTVLSTDASVLPVVALTDSNTIRLEVSLYNQTTALTSYTPIGLAPAIQNQFTTSFPIQPTVQETTVQMIGRNYDPTALWLANTSYNLGARYADPNGNVEVVVGTTGNTGLIQPQWSRTLPTVITNIGVSSNVVTVLTANNFTQGQQVYLSDIVNATFVNNTVVTVTTATSTQFTATINHVDYLAANDMGAVNTITTDGQVQWANIGTTAITPTIKFTLLFFQSNLAIVIAPPSGISAQKNQTDCTLQWVTPDYPGFIGVRVMISTDPAGVNPPYVQFGDLVYDVSSTAPAIISTQTNTAVSVPTAFITGIQLSNNTLTVSAVNTFTQGTVVEFADLANAVFLNNETATVTSATNVNFMASFTALDYPATTDNGTATSTVSTNTTTIIETVQNTNFSSVDIPSSLINASVFYSLFSTVIQDPTTNALYESVQNGPLLGGFVNLQVVNPTDFPVLQRKEDIAGRLIGQIIRQQPNLDLSPRSEIRDIFIDPFSIETANMSVRDWFARVSTSISAISQVDDTTGTGVSDPFQSSPYKQQLARAYGLSPQDTQSLIDEQFDILGEQAGLTRGAPSASTVVLTFYTYQQPQASISVPQNAVVATLSDANTPALNFITQGQATMDLSNLNSFYNTQTGWWGVSVPAQCSTTGSNGNVGAGTIRQVVSNAPSGMNVTNLLGANYGTDEQSNSSFAAMIQARVVTGVDTGTRHGYLVTALGTPGIIDAQVVAAGDLEMLRDWDPIRQKHVYGCVDIYTRGVTLSEQDETVAFEYASSGVYGTTNTYLLLTYATGLKFQITNFTSVPYPLYSGVELWVSRASNGFYLNTARAQFDNVNGYIILNPNDMAYQYVGSTLTQAQVFSVNGTALTNQAAISTLIGPTAGTYSFNLFARYESPFVHVPALQPVLDVYAVTGQATETGALPDTVVNLIHTSDFLLNGGSNAAGDEVQVSISSAPVTSTITAIIGTNVQIALAMDVPLDSNGNPIDVLSVRSTDLSTLYKVGVDYTIVPLGPYHTYGLQVLTSSVPLSSVQITGNVVTVVAPNEFGIGAPITFSAIPDLTLGPILNGQTLTIATATALGFTATGITNPDVSLITTTGQVTGSAIQNNHQVVVAYNQFVLYERLTFTAEEQQVLNGTLPTTLNNDGFVNNTWLPQSYPFAIDGVTPGTELILDGWNGLYGSDGGLDVVGSATFDPSGLVGAQVSYASRYIKVTYNNGMIDVVKKEGIDFALSVDPVSGAATLSRILTGTIPDGGTVSVSYFSTEPFTFSTEYPTFVEVLANEIAITKHAAADVLIKSMVASSVDLTLAVTLNANALPEMIDPVIRTVINIVLDNAQNTLFQSELITQVQSINGVQSVEVPLLECVKSNGSYDIGVVIPTGTSWIPLAQDPLFASLPLPSNAWISTQPVLPDSTIPSGGEPLAIVDFLYEGQVFRRAMSVMDFLNNSPLTPLLASNASPGSFYIIGLNDQINNTTPIPNTYQQRILLVIPQDIVNPGNVSFLCTYQVFNASGAKDITVSATEYLSPGVITINYVTG